MGKIKRSGELFVQAWGVLKGDPALAMFPIISSVATLAVVASFVLPVALSPDLRQTFASVLESQGRHAAHAAAEDGQAVSAGGRVLVLGIMFAFYLVTSFVTIFFNAALLGAADRKFRGEPTGVSVGISVAMSRLPQIIGWSILSAIVGTILRALEERVGFLGRIVIGLLGVGWAIASYFAVPALVLEGVGPIEAVKRSVSAIRKSWGEGLVLAVGFGLAGFLVTLLVLVIIAAGIVLGIMTESVALGIAVGSLGVLLLLAWGVVASTLKTIVQMALYRYAVDGVVPNGFQQSSLAGAFTKK